MLYGIFSIGICFLSRTGYAITYSTICAYYRSYLVYYGNQGLSSPSMLPMGNYEIGFLNEMELYIVDSVGDNYLQLQNVTVSIKV